MLANHRRALGYSLALLSFVAFVFVAVGIHPPEAAPRTDLSFIGEWDRTVYRWMDDARSAPLDALARVLNVLGAGIVTIPLRLLVAGWLAFLTRWRAVAVWLGTWAVAELVLAVGKASFHRGRPPGALVEVNGFSFPSGHAVAGASIAVALVLVSMPPGPKRRRWEWGAAAFAFVMGSSRVYLHAHWLSDVVAGVLLGSGVAVGVAGLLTEIRDRTLHRGPHALPGRPGSGDRAEGDGSGDRAGADSRSVRQSPDRPQTSTGPLDASSSGRATRDR